MNFLTNEQKYMCKKISDKYGKGQLIVCMEEMAELSQALSKLLRLSGAGQPTRIKSKEEIISKITEEISDVMITLEQVGTLLNISNADIQKMIDYKLERSLKGE